MKKIIALGIATCFAFSAHADQTVTNTGKSYLRFETPFQSASPERVSNFAAPEFRDKHRANHNGDVQFIVFGGQNTNQDTAAQYFFPRTNSGSIVFNSSVTGDTVNLGGDTLETYWYGAQDTTWNTTTAGNPSNGGVTLANFNAGANAIGYMGAQNGPSIAGVVGAPSAGAGINLLLTPEVVGIPDPTTEVSVTTNPLGYGQTFGASPFPITTGQVLLNNDGTFNDSQNQFAINALGTAGNFVPYNLADLQALVNDDNAAVGDFRLDSNRSSAVVRPWNLGIGFAPNVQMGDAVTQSTFVSVITPELERSQWGIGATWKQILSEKDTGFWLELSTAVQSVTMNMELNEKIVSELSYNLDVPHWVGHDGQEVTDADQYGYQTFDTVETVAQAFKQDAWKFGRIDGAQTVTRLADIELKLGYQFVCEDNVLSNAYVGMIIPTGNKATGEFMAEPIVGNGFHFGLMAGSTAEIQLNAGADTRWSSRSDVCYRYLFQNTQVRSIDTKNGNWSRYMMVWPNYEAEQLAELTPASSTLRDYTPGINVFTREVNVTPQAVIRYNQALILESGGFKGEMGWNVLIRQDELVELEDKWVDNQIVYADASNANYSLYNANRTIYNDAYQSTPVADTIAGDSQARYNAASVKFSDLNLSSAASWSTMVNTPYLVLGYGFNEERSSILSIGGSYEFTASNDYINDWMLWGKFSFTF